MCWTFLPCVELKDIRNFLIQFFLCKWHVSCCYTHWLLICSQRVGIWIRSANDLTHNPTNCDLTRELFDHDLPKFASISSWILTAESNIRPKNGYNCGTFSFETMVVFIFKLEALNIWHTSWQGSSFWILLSLELGAQSTDMHL